MNNLRKISLILIIALTFSVIQIAPNTNVIAKDMYEDKAEISNILENELCGDVRPGFNDCIQESVVINLGEDIDYSERLDAASVNTNIEVNNVQSEFNINSAKFGWILNDQMTNYLTNNSNYTSAEVKSDSSVSGFKTSVMFDFSSYNESFYASEDELLLWLYDAMSVYSSLGALNTSVSYYTIGSGSSKKYTKIYVYSTISADKLRDRTLSYKKELNELVSVPLSSNMSDIEKILYVHDRVVSTGNYVSTSGDNTQFSSAAILLDSKGVCQSYAFIFNNLMSMMGLDCITVCGCGHAWNAIRLNEKWYYVDMTWDDPVASSGTLRRSYISHEFMFVKTSAFSSMHTLETKYSKNYGSILSQFGNQYDDFFPKKNKIENGMWYVDGKWFYVNSGKVYTWDGSSTSGTLFDKIPYSSSNQLVGIYNQLYYSNSTGLYKYNKNGTPTTVVTGNITDMYLERETIKYVMNGSTKSLEIVEQNTPTPIPTAKPTATPSASTAATPPVGTATPPASTAATPPVGTATPPASPTATPPVGTTTATATPPAGITETATPPVGTTATPPASPTAAAALNVTASPEATVIPSTAAASEAASTPAVNSKPGSTVILKLTGVKGKKVVVKIKKASNINGYQIAFQNKRKLNKPKLKYTTKTSVTISKLDLNKVFYIKVRTYVIVNNKKVFGKWSKVKHIKINK